MAKSKRVSGARESGARHRRQASAESPRLGRRDPLRAEINAGIESLDRGHFTEVSDRSLERYVGDLGKPTRPRNS